MKTQIFKNNVPNEILYDFLDKIYSFKNDKYYTIDILSYKKGIYTNENDQSNDISDFLEQVKPYYHLSKQFYIDRPMTFPRLTTIIRQICKANDIQFASQIKYDKSKYNLIYYVYIC